MLVFGAKLCLLEFLLFHCEFSVFRRPIAAKFWSVIGSVFDFIIPIMMFAAKVLTVKCESTKSV